MDYKEKTHDSPQSDSSEELAPPSTHTPTGERGPAKAHRGLVTAIRQAWKDYVTGKEFRKQHLVPLSPPSYQQQPIRAQGGANTRSQHTAVCRSNEPRQVMRNHDRRDDEENNNNNNEDDDDHGITSLIRRGSWRLEDSDDYHWEMRASCSWSWLGLQWEAGYVLDGDSWELVTGPLARWPSGIKVPESSKPAKQKQGGYFSKDELLQWTRRPDGRHGRAT